MRLYFVQGSCLVHKHGFEPDRTADACRRHRLPPPPLLPLTATSASGKQGSSLRSLKPPCPSPVPALCRLGSYRGLGRENAIAKFSRHVLDALPKILLGGAGPSAAEQARQLGPVFSPLWAVDAAALHPYCRTVAHNAVCWLRRQQAAWSSMLHALSCGQLLGLLGARGFAPEAGVCRLCLCTQQIAGVP